MNRRLSSRSVNLLYLVTFLVLLIGSVQLSTSTGELVGCRASMGDRYTGWHAVEPPQTLVV